MGKRCYKEESRLYESHGILFAIPKTVFEDIVEQAREIERLKRAVRKWEKRHEK